MVRYGYMCVNEGCSVFNLTAMINYPMGDAPSCVNCSACGKIARRVYTVPQLNTRPALFSDENKQGLAEMNAKAGVEDKQYAQSWSKRMGKLD